jgi:hypothetical protein
VWWVDVEIGEQWPTTSVDKPVNAAIIQGALDAIKDAGHIGGVYSTWFQWGEITGSYIPPGSPPLWVPGADTLTGGDFSAQSFCQRALSPGTLRRWLRRLSASPAVCLGSYSTGMTVPPLPMVSTRTIRAAW